MALHNRAEKRDLNKQRLCRNPCFSDDFFWDRMTPDGRLRTTEEADDCIRSLLSVMCDKNEATKRRKLINFPEAWDEKLRDAITKKILVLPKSELDPVKTLSRVYLWMEMDQVNTQFDAWHLLQLCSDILADVLEELRDHPQIGERVLEAFYLQNPIRVVSLLITYAVGEEDASKIRPDVPMSRPRLEQLKRIYATIQKHYLRADVTKPGEKTGVGDTCIAKMVAFVGEKRRGNWASPESFFDGRGWDDADYPVLDE
jgi:hypothetical protein